MLHGVRLCGRTQVLWCCSHLLATRRWRECHWPSKDARMPLRSRQGPSAWQCWSSLRRHPRHMRRLHRPGVAWRHIRSWQSLVCSEWGLRLAHRARWGAEALMIMHGVVGHTKRHLQIIWELGVLNKWVMSVAAERGTKKTYIYIDYIYIDMLFLSAFWFNGPASI